ncbi:MAG: DNA polymerase III subunit gamma/tau, partial [Bacteroidota bacterium]
MENFIVSARKYRPSVFDEVVGQRHITDTLLNEINNNHLAQAFLFTGPRGVGKTTCARILAKVINQKDSDSTEQDYAFNIFELDAASNNSVEDIRNLNDQVRIPPQVGSYKVYIIDEVHMLSTAAFNAFLKTLEEPPKYAIFILATTEKHKILPTILSRCQIFNFKRIQVKDMVGHLKSIVVRENIQAEDEALHLIAEKADGGLRDALSMFDQMVSFCNGNITYTQVVDNLNLLDKDYYFKVTDAILSQNVGEVLNFFDQILEKGFDGQLFLNGLNEHFRNLMVCKDAATVHLLDVGENH